MTNEEAAMLLNGSGDSVNTSAGTSEPANASNEVKDAPATVADDPKPNTDTVEPTETKPQASETSGKGKRKEPEKRLYSQERANHEFARQSRKIANLTRQNEELKKELEKYSKTNRDTFVDKITGKLDEAGYVEFVSKKAVAEERAKRLDGEIQELQDEADETEWNDRVVKELGDEADSFNNFCEEIVDEENGQNRFGAFIEWLKGRDQNSVCVSRLNASPNRVKLLRELMTNKEARVKIVKATSPYKMEMVLDEIEAGIKEGRGQAEAKPKQTFAQAWKDRPKESKPEARAKPTGSAFSGETKSAGKTVKDNNYFASLLK